MSKFKSITTTERHSFQVNKTWNLNQESTDESFQQSYKSGSTWKNDTYHLLSDTPAAISESYWHSLSFNFFASASHFEGYPQELQNVKNTAIEHKNTKSQLVDDGKLKWLNDYYSQAHIHLNKTAFPINLNKFGKNWIQGNIISISQGVYGEAIKPGSVTLTDNSTAYQIKLKDDSYGNLYAVNPILSQSNNSPSSSTNHIGNVFYNHGLIVLKETSSFSASSPYTSLTTSQYDLEFQSTKTINTTEYTCVLEPTEFMITTNPSAGDGSGSFAKNIDIKNDGWTPYLTTIGLYDSKDRLVMVGRLSQPVKRSKTLPLTIKLIYDY